MIAGDIPDLVEYVDVKSIRVHAPTPAVFLCGGPVDATAPVATSLRDAFLRIQHERPFSRYSIILAEDLNAFFPDGNYQDILKFETDIAQICELASAPVRYKEYFIPKRNGDMRKIAQPAREVKILQRIFVAKFLIHLPIHQNAVAYRKGLSIRDNAEPHIGAGPIIKLDLRNFFPSIKGRDWVSYCRDSGCLQSEEEIHLTTLLLFHKQQEYRLLRLAVGAPSSPILSNILMYNFDKRITELVSKDRVIYTRYADDLTFSAPRAGFLNGVVKAVAKTIRSQKYPNLEINGDKTAFITSKYHRTVTGLTISNDGRVTIGRDRKRELHAAVHQALNSKLSSQQLRALAGTLAYVNSVEPNFLNVLREKYGVDIVSYIQQYVIIGQQS